MIKCDLSRGKPRYKRHFLSTAFHFSKIVDITIILSFGFNHAVLDFMQDLNLLILHSWHLTSNNFSIVVLMLMFCFFFNVIDKFRKT